MSTTLQTIATQTLGLIVTAEEQKSRATLAGIVQALIEPKERSRFQQISILNNINAQLQVAFIGSEQARFRARIVELQKAINGFVVELKPELAGGLA